MSQLNNDFKNYLDCNNLLYREDQIGIKVSKSTLKFILTNQQNNLPDIVKIVLPKIIHNTRDTESMLMYINKRTSFATVLNSLFNWAGTSEGQRFWLDLHVAFSEYKFLDYIKFIKCCYPDE